jgi:hypothetical protein
LSNAESLEEIMGKHWDSEELVEELQVRLRKEERRYLEDMSAATGRSLAACIRQLAFVGRIASAETGESHDRPLSAGARVR